MKVLSGRNPTALSFIVFQLFKIWVCPLEDKPHNFSEKNNKSEKVIYNDSPKGFTEMDCTQGGIVLKEISLRSSSVLLGSAED